MLRLVRTLVTSIGARPRGRGVLVASADQGLRSAFCLDVRPAPSLSAGIVTGAWIVPAADAARFAHLWRHVVVLGDPSVVEALRESGVEAEPSAGIAAWVAAGRAVHEPAWKSPMPVGSPVRHRGREGWVQDVRWSGTEFRFDVRVGPELERVEDLPEEALEAPAGRGAAGLGTVV